MNIEDFCRLNKTTTKNVEWFVKKWVYEKQVNDLLGTTIAGGIALGDLLVGDGLRDQISPELYNGFKELMGDKADSFDKVRELLVEKLEKGASSVLGLVNKVKGQIGENHFVKLAGSTASLAKSGSQEAWDVVIHHENASAQYIQVKMYGTAGSVVEHMKEVNNKLGNPNYLIANDLGEQIDRIDFAVPGNIANEVKRRAQESGLDTKVLPIDMTADEAAGMVMEGVNNVGPKALENFFGELLRNSVHAGALHGLVNAFLLYKGAKDSSQFCEDTVYSTFVSSGGFATGMVAESILRKIAIVGTPATIGVFFISLVAREILKRIADRRDYVRWISESSLHLEKTISALENSLLPK